MKVVFLDIDGVLNSLSYYEKINAEKLDILNNPIDERSVYCLKQIIDRTGAKIVLSSSWRGGWNKNPDLCDFQGKIINEILKKFNMEIYDCTESLNFNDGTARSREIRKWLCECQYKISGFVIIDDGNFSWEKFGLSTKWVRTNFKENGLQKHHIEEAVNILEKNDPWLKLRNIFKKQYMKMSI